MTTARTKTPIDTARLLAERSLLVTLNVSRWRPKKSDQKVTSEVLKQKHAETGTGQFVKHLMPKDALEAVDKVEHRARVRHQGLTLPWKDEGWRILASQTFLTYQKEFRNIREEFDEAVRLFLDKYPEYVNTAPARLKDLYLASDFPEAKEIASRFRFRVDFLPMPTAADFRVNLPPGQLEALQENLQEQMQEAAQAARQDVWSRLAAPLQAMVDRLNKPETDFKTSLFGNVLEIAEQIPNLLTQEDPELTRLSAEAKRLVSSQGLMAEVKGSPEKRKETVNRVEDLLRRMSAYQPVTS